MSDIRPIMSPTINMKMPQSFSYSCLGMKKKKQETHMIILKAPSELKVRGNEINSVYFVLHLAANANLRIPKTVSQLWLTWQPTSSSSSPKCVSCISQQVFIPVHCQFSSCNIQCIPNTINNLGKATFRCRFMRTLAHVARATSCLDTDQCTRHRLPCYVLLLTPCG